MKSVARFAVAGAALLPLLLGACTASRELRPRDPISNQSLDSSPHTRVAVRVENQNWEAMTLYVSRSGSLIRLGIVEGLDDRTFTLPAAFVHNAGAIQLVAETRISRQRYVLPSVNISPGSNLLAVLESHLPLSFVSLYR